MRLSADLRALVVLTWQPGNDGEVSVFPAALSPAAGADRSDCQASGPVSSRRGRDAPGHQLGARARSEAVPGAARRDADRRLGGVANFTRAAELCDELLS